MSLTSLTPESVLIRSENKIESDAPQSSIIEPHDKSLASSAHVQLAPDPDHESSSLTNESSPDESDELNQYFSNERSVLTVSRFMQLHDVPLLESALDSLEPPQSTRTALHAVRCACHRAVAHLLSFMSVHTCIVLSF